MKLLLNTEETTQAVKQLAKAIVHRHAGEKELLIMGIQQGGVVVADALLRELKALAPSFTIHYGQLDITFYRDDFRNEILAPDPMHLPVGIENQTIILVDDVLFTGRTIKAALDALLDYGRPAKVELCVLVDRREHRQFPIQADYSAANPSTSRTDKVKLRQDNEGLQVVLIEN